MAVFVVRSTSTMRGSDQLRDTTASQVNPSEVLRGAAGSANTSGPYAPYQQASSMTQG